MNLLKLKAVILDTKDICKVSSINFVTGKILLEHKGCYYTEGHLSEVDLMFPSGLLDIKGQDIYSGHIVESRKQRYVVTWDDDQSCFFCGNLPQGRLGALVGYVRELGGVEIVGDVWHPTEPTVDVASPGGYAYRVQHGYEITCVTCKGKGRLVQSFGSLKEAYSCPCPTCMGSGKRVQLV